MDPSNESSTALRKPTFGRELVAGIAATLLFFFSVLFIPMFGFLVGVFTPLPTVLVLYRWGVPSGYWVPGLAAALGCLILVALEMSLSVPYLLAMLGLGVMLGLGMRRRWSFEKTIGVPSLLVFGGGALTFLAFHSGTEAGLIGYLEQAVRESIAVALKEYGVASGDTRALAQSLQAVVPVMVRLLPGIALSSALFASWLNVLATVRYIRVHQLTPPFWGEWTRWQAPEHLVWGVIASGFALMVPFGPFKIVGLNVLMVLATVYLFQGMAIIAFYMERKKVPRFLRAVIYGFILLQMVATAAAILVGLFDMWFDFRRLKPKPEKERDE